MSLAEDMLEQRLRSAAARVPPGRKDPKTAVLVRARQLRRRRVAAVALPVWVVGLVAAVVAILIWPTGVPRPVQTGPSHGRHVTVVGPPIWAVRSTFPSWAIFNNVACPSRTVCYAVGGNDANLGAVATTVDSGRTWTRQPMPAGVGELSYIACSTTTRCVATGDLANHDFSADLLTTSDAGRKWRTVRSSETVAIGPAVCPTANTCYVVFGTAGNRFAYYLLVTTNGGESWRQEALPNVIDALACPSATVCYAAGQGANFAENHYLMVTTDSGSTWRRQGVTHWEPSSVACPVTSTCYAVGNPMPGMSPPVQMFTTTDGGASWAAATFPQQQEQTSPVLACPARSTCFTTGPGLFVTTNGGATWDEKNSSSPVGLSCPSVRVCYAVGAGTAGGSQTGFLATTDGGETWRPQSLSRPAVGGITSITCPTELECFAVGEYSGALLASTNAGSTWTIANVPVAGTLLAVSCATPTRCYAVGEGASTGSGGEIIATFSGGSTWSVQAQPTELGSVSAIACVSAAVCYAVANPISTMIGGGGFAEGGSATVLTTTDSGTRWIVKGRLPLTGFKSMVCTSGLDCYAAGSAGTAGALFDPGGPVIVSTSDGGSTWTTSLAGSYDLDQLACSSRMDCMAVGTRDSEHSGGSDNSDNAVVLATGNGGRTWSTRTPTRAVSATAVGCGAAACFVAGEIGQHSVILRTTNLGVSWVAQLGPSSVIGIADIVCSGRLCYAAGSAIGVNDGVVLFRAA